MNALYLFCWEYNMHSLWDIWMRLYGWETIWWPTMNYMPEIATKVAKQLLRLLGEQKSCERVKGENNEQTKNAACQKMG